LQITRFAENMISLVEPGRIAAVVDRKGVASDADAH
jgi:hypothetical protein